MTKRFWVLESLGLGFKIPMEDEREREREHAISTRIAPTGSSLYLKILPSL
nr:hypothetical protein Itr_chr01CG12800 [Ipomoea trifida]